MHKINNKNKLRLVKGESRKQISGTHFRQDVQQHLDCEAGKNVRETHNGLKFGAISHKLSSKHSGTFLEDLEIH
jgi:hypothetical protein